MQAVVYPGASEKQLVQQQQQHPTQQQREEQEEKNQHTSSGPKQQAEFRLYSPAADDPVRRFYQRNHEKQSFAKVQELRQQYLQLKRGEFTVMEMFELADQILDESDPDTSLSQLHHAIQTAEHARKAFPEERWFHLAAFLHDLGKILCLPVGSSKEAIEAYPALEMEFVVGDTFVLGIDLQGTTTQRGVIYPELFRGNPDWSNVKCQNEGRSNESTNDDDGAADEKGSKKDLGVYTEKCGLDSLVMSFGHDEYLAAILNQNSAKFAANRKSGGACSACSSGNGALDPRLIGIVRYHSCYALHQKGCYREFCTDADLELIPWLVEFQKCDLYSKDSAAVDYVAYEEYYRELVDEFIGLETKLAV